MTPYHLHMSDINNLLYNLKLLLEKSNTENKITLSQQQIKNLIETLTDSKNRLTLVKRALLQTTF